MGRTVADVAILLNGLAGADDDDPAGPAAKAACRRRLHDISQGRRAQGQTLRRAAPGDGVSPRRRQIDERRDRGDEGAGAEVIDVKVATYNDWNDAEFEVLLYEFKDGLNTYLKNSGSPHSVARGADRVEQGATPARRCRSSARRSSSARRRRAR